MMLLVLLWLWSNEDLLNLVFHEFLVIGLSIQPLLHELETSIPSCVVDISQSILLPATHTISCNFEWLCLDTEIRTPNNWHVYH